MDPSDPGHPGPVDPAARPTSARRWKLAVLVLALLLAAAVGALVYGAVDSNDASDADDDVPAMTDEERNDPVEDEDVESTQPEEATPTPPADTAPGDMDAADDDPASEADSGDDAADVVLDCPAFGLTGIEGEPGAGYFDISTRNLPCADAKPLLLDLDRTRSPSQIRGFSCMKLEDLNEAQTWRCERDGQAIRFSVGA